MTLDPAARSTHHRVMVAPSPATSGTTFSIDATGDYLFNAFEQSVPFKVTVYPQHETPTKTNSEVILVEAYTSGTRTGSVAVTETLTGQLGQGSVDIYEWQPGDSSVPQSEVQILTVDGTTGTYTLTAPASAAYLLTESGGKFLLEDGGFVLLEASAPTSSVLNSNALPAAIQAALEGLAPIGSGNVLVAFQTAPMQVAALAYTPTLFWRLGEPSGATAADTSGNSNTGTYSGVTLAQAGLEAGDSSSSVKLPDSGKVTSSYSPFVAGSRRTFCGVASRLSTASIDTLFAGSATSNPTALVCASGSEDVSFSSGGSSVTWSAAWPGLSQAVWWALTYDDTTKVAELYINGASKGTRTIGAGYATPGTFQAGCNGASTNPWNGYLQDVAVYEGLLGAGAVRVLYLAGSAPGGNPSYPMTVTFRAALANTPVSLLTADATNLVSSTQGSVQVWETTVGLAPSTSEVQSVAVSAVTGTFTMSFGGQTTDDLAWNITADSLAAELCVLSSVGSGNVEVEGVPGGPYSVTFQGSLANAPRALLTADVTLLTDGGESETQTVAVDATGGTFRLSADGGANYTSALAYTASASTVQSALQGLTAIGAGNCAVSLDAAALTYQVNWAGALAGTLPALLTADVSSLTAATQDITSCVRAQDNTTARAIIVGDHVEQATLIDRGALSNALVVGGVETSIVPDCTKGEWQVWNVDSVFLGGVFVFPPSNPPPSYRSIRLAVALYRFDTAFAIDWDPIYKAAGFTLPTASASTSGSTVGAIFQWDGASWICQAVLSDYAGGNH